MLHDLISVRGSIPDPVDFDLESIQMLKSHLAVTGDLFAKRWRLHQPRELGLNQPLSDVGIGIYPCAELGLLEEIRKTTANLRQSRDQLTKNLCSRSA